ncbi:hypothetical protein EDD86DRAFT_199268, partial [Gorgonomyces haynaldii]
MLQALFTASLIGSALAQNSTSSACSKVDTFVEWREMTDEQQDRYIAATLCLQRAPSKIDPSLTRPYTSPSLWDDLVWVHLQAAKIEGHRTAYFLPWHRLLLAAHDELMKTACNYDGPFPYWDWSRDSQAPEGSELWTKFGSNGRAPNYCVRDGAFTGQRLHFLAGNNGNIRFSRRGECLRRQWDLENLLSAGYSNIEIHAFALRPDYDSFRQDLEFIPHNQVHSSLGGTMGTLASSNDPIFYLHHRNIDHLWYLWAELNPEMANTFSGTGIADGMRAASADKPMEMFGLIPDYRVSELLDTVGGGAGGRMCYKYSRSIEDSSDDRGFVPEKRGLMAGFEIYKRDGSSSASPFYSPYGDPNNPITPPPGDRMDKYNLRYSAPTPDWFVKHWHYKEEEILALREAEKNANMFTDYINSVNGFVSGQCLYSTEKARRNGYRACPEERYKAKRMIYELMYESFRMAKSEY